MKSLWEIGYLSLLCGVPRHETAEAAGKNPRVSSCICQWGEEQCRPWLGRRAAPEQLKDSIYSPALIPSDLDLAITARTKDGKPWAGGESNLLALLGKEKCGTCEVTIVCSTFNENRGCETAALQRNYDSDFSIRKLCVIIFSFIVMACVFVLIPKM